MSLLDELNNSARKPLALGAAGDAKALEAWRIASWEPSRVKNTLGLVGKAPPDIKPQAANSPSDQE